MSVKKKSRLKKILIYSSISIVSILIIAVTLFFVFLDQIVESRLKSLLEKKFGDYYTLEFDEMQQDIGFTEMTFVLKGARLTSDTTDLESVEKFPVLFFDAKELRLEKLSTWDILLGGEIDIESLQIVEPNFSTFTRKKVEKKPDELKNKRGKSLLSMLRINSFSLVNGHVEVHDFEEKKRVLLNESINFEVTNVQLNLENLDDIKSALEYKSFTIQSDHSELYPLTGLYKFSMDTLSIKSENGNISFKNIKIDTKIDIKEASKLKVNHSEVVNLIVEEVTISGFDFSKLIYQDAVQIDKIEVSDADVYIFKNKTTQMDPTFRKKVLNQIFRQIKYPIKVDSIKLNNLNLDFELMANTIKKPAFITLDSVNGTLTDFNTNPADKDTLKIRVSTLLMEKGHLNLNVDIAIWDEKSNYQKFYGNLSGMPFSVWNSTIQNFANVKINSGYIHRLDFVGYTNEHRSWGAVAFRYDNLGLNIYSLKDPLEKRENKLLSNIVKMAIHENNPLKNGDFRQAQFEFKRERWEGSIMQWLGGILVGMFKTTLKDAVLDIIKNENQKKINKELKIGEKRARDKQKRKAKIQTVLKKDANKKEREEKSLEKKSAKKKKKEK